MVGNKQYLDDSLRKPYDLEYVGFIYLEMFYI